VIVTPLKSPPPEMYRDGVAVITHRTERITDHSAAAGAKVGNYLMAVLANREARLANAAEALIVDGRGCVVEGATSNVFVVRGDGTLVTPPESDGILLGITRETVLAVAARLGVPIELESLPLDAVKGAAEVFFCSSIRELMPVVSIDGSKIANGTPGPTTLRLLAAVREACRHSTAP
jgi:branched-chain amino acid aminotransferase